MSQLEELVSTCTKVLEALTKANTENHLVDTQSDDCYRLQFKRLKDAMDLVASVASTAFALQHKVGPKEYFGLPTHIWFARQRPDEIATSDTWGDSNEQD